MRFIIFIVGKRKLHKIHRKLCKNLSLPSSDVYHRYLSDGKYSFDKYSLLLVAKIFFLPAVTIKTFYKTTYNSIYKCPCHSSSFLLSQYPTVLIFTNVITKGHKGSSSIQDGCTLKQH